MAAERMQYCFNCGKELGVYRSYAGDIECCGEVECINEARNADRQAREERQFNAEQDEWRMY